MAHITLLITVPLALAMMVVIGSGVGVGVLVSTSSTTKQLSSSLLILGTGRGLRVTYELVGDKSRLIHTRSNLWRKRLINYCIVIQWFLVQIVRVLSKDAIILVILQAAGVRTRHAVLAIEQGRLMMAETTNRRYSIYGGSWGWTKSVEVVIIHFLRWFLVLILLGTGHLRTRVTILFGSTQWFVTVRHGTDCKDLVFNSTTMVIKKSWLISLYLSE